jgi:hypothetical protein
MFENELTDGVDVVGLDSLLQLLDSVIEPSTALEKATIVIIANLGLLID